METNRERVISYIHEHKNRAFQLLSSLVQQRSTQGNEHGAQSVLIDYLRQLPLTLDIWDISPDEMRSSPYFISGRKDFVNCSNVAAVLKGSGGGKSLLLNGHIDVVPEGDRKKWTDDPYSGSIRDGKMYGRGTTDMKGGSVSLLMAIESIVRCGIKLKGDLIFESVIEEESGGAGTLSATMRGYKADAAIIPEPTNMKLFIKQQGSMWFRISIPGKSAHAGTRYEGISAIEKAWIMIEAIQVLEKKRNQRITDPLYQAVPIPLPINIGKIEGGSWPSSVPDLVVLEGRMGAGPEELLEDAKSELENCITEVCKQDPWLSEHPAKIDFFGAQWLPNSVRKAHPLVSVLNKEYRDIYGKSMIIEASPWGTDAGILGTVGEIPTLVIGPGETRVAHYPDEFIDLHEMVLAAQFFASTILEWCETI